MSRSQSHAIKGSRNGERGPEVQVPLAERAGEDLEQGQREGPGARGAKERAAVLGGEHGGIHAGQ